MAKLYFIVNPVSGSGEGMRRFLFVRGIMEQRGIEYGYCFSEYPGHAVKLAREAIDAGETRIVAVGGDGTLNEVASVVKDHKGIKLGVLPFGTGNDFAHGIGLPESNEELVDVLSSDISRPLDAGMAGGAFFINVSGYGFDVDVVRYTDKYKRKLNGMLPYLLGIFESLIHLSCAKTDIVTDDGRHYSADAIMLTACNGRRFAGGINCAPDAEYDDGLIDFCLIKKVSRLRFLYLLPKYMKGKHLKYKEFIYFRAKSIQVTTDLPTRIECDGEPKGTTPAEFSVLHGVLDFITGK